MRNGITVFHGVYWYTCRSQSQIYVLKVLFWKQLFFCPTPLYLKEIILLLLYYYYKCYYLS